MPHSAYRRSLLVFVVAAALARAANAQPVASTAQPLHETEKTLASAVLRAVFAAAERNDMRALDTLYAGDSLTVVEGAGINRGWVDYRDHHLAPELKEMQNFHYRPVDIEMHVSGSTAWAIFRYNLKGAMGARTLDNVGRGTAILERRGTGASARWIVRHTQTTSRARRPNDPPAG